MILRQKNDGPSASGGSSGKSLIGASNFAETGDNR
jgi:hypothetical protein